MNACGSHEKCKQKIGYKKVSTQYIIYIALFPTVLKVFLGRGKALEDTSTFTELLTI